MGLLLLLALVAVESHSHPTVKSTHGKQDELGLVLLQRQATAVARDAQGLALHHAGAVEDAQNPAVDLRPSQGGAADVVHFGMLVKAYGGVDLKTSTWSADLVITARWVDPRTSGLVPAGSTSITLPTAKAVNQLWLPDLVVTNRAKQGIDIISSAVSIESTGIVTKTERLLATLRASLDLRDFPFDSQELTVILSSSALMFNELKVQPMENVNGLNVSGVRSGIFSAKEVDLVKFNTTEFEETDGSLQKSRGLLTLNVQRKSMPLVQSLLVPQLLLLLVSWSVFWFPLQPAYVMPRVATGALALVALMAFSARMASAMPPDCGLTWVDVFCGACQYLMIWAMVFNIFIDIIKEMHLSTADTVNEELKYKYGIVIAIVMITLVFGIGGGSNTTLSLFTKLEVFGINIPYMMYCIFRARRENAKDQAASPRRPQ